MQYELTEDQEMMRKTVRDLAQKVIAPRAAAIDEEAEFPWDVKEELAKYGWLSLVIPEEYGGSGAPLLTTCVVVEEIAKVCTSSSLILAVHGLGSFPMVIAASPEQKAKYFPKLASGEHLVAFALTEPGAGSDVASLSTVAVREGDHYRLNGTKCFITHGSVADLFSAFAVTDPSLGAKGLSAFIVEKGFPGCKVGKLEHKMGIRGSPTAEIIFEDCIVPAENLLGKEGDGFRIAMQTLDKSRPTIGAQAVGIAAGALEFAASYAKQRVVFKQSLASLQAIQFKLADMAIRTEAARQLVYKAACLVDQGSREMSKFSAMAKCFAADTAMWVTTEAVQVLGGYGYMKEYPLERMMRDAKVTQIYEGTNEIQRLVVARAVLG
jgi:alkylation response protein AidB-like acyl-CoA dehydrogenase